MNTQQLRSRSGRIIAVVSITFASIGAISLAGEPISALLREIWVYAWFGFFAWLMFWNPSVRISETEIVVNNVFRSTSLNWSSIRRIDTKYSLSLETEIGVIRAWAAPAPSRYSGFLASKSEAHHLPESSFIGNGLVRPGDLTSSDSGVAAYVIRRHWEELRDRTQLDNKPVVVTSWVFSRISVFAVLSIAAIFSITS